MSGSRRRVTVFVAAAAMVLSGCSVLSTDGTAGKASAPPGAVSAQPVPTVVVLDASDSMNTADAPGPRIDAAKDAVASLADWLPEKTDLAVVVFGSQMPAHSTPRAQACTDVQTVVPLASVDAQTLSTALDAVHAQGFTPIGTALTEAARQLPPTGPASIVLVSDGESTCAPDPCATAAAIHSGRPDVTISAVGFRSDAASLQCVAADGGGLFVTADNAAQLTARLSAAQNSRAAATRLSTTGRDDIAIGTTLGDIRTAHPDFPAQGRTDGDRTSYIWRDCTYVFDRSNALVELAPGDPPGAAGTTIDGVTRGTKGSRAVELYGEPVEDSGGVAIFPADEKAGTAYRIGYEGGKSITDGTVTTVVLCGCLPEKKPTGETTRSTDGPEVVTVIAVDKKGTLKSGYTLIDDGSTRSFPASEMQYCSSGLGALTPGVFRCGTTADSAVVCWDKAATSQLLCGDSPWEKGLRAWTYGTPPRQRPVKPQDEVTPWALELADGSQCIQKFGGAWDFLPTGYLYAFGCGPTGATGSVVVRDGAEVPADLFDKSGRSWSVLGRARDGQKAITPITVTKIYYSAADQ